MEVNNSLGPIDIAISGLRAQSRNMEVISSNVANSQTVDGGGKPYRRLETTFRAAGKGLSGVKIGDIVQDSSKFQRVFKPGHPQADKDGYLTMPNVRLPVEMMNLSVASRAYQANAAILKRYQKMVETSLELLR